MITTRDVTGLLLLLVTLTAGAATADDQLAQARLTAQPGAAVDPALIFTDTSGHKVAIGDYFDGRPLLLALVYYDCPNLCGVLLQGLARSVGRLDLQPQRDFQVLAVSIDPHEQPQQARSARNELFAGADPAVYSGWHFLTGTGPAVSALAAAVGFAYAYDGQLKQYAHPALITVLSGNGHISSYLYGIDFPARSLRLALVAAAQGAIGSLSDQLLLRCYSYDPVSGRYTLQIVGLLRLAGVATMLLLAGSIGWLLLRERRRPQAPKPRQP